MEEKQIPHISIGGFPGVGKTRILLALLARYKLHIIPRYTTRDRRPGEEMSKEYRFVSQKLFDKLLAKGYFIPGTIRTGVENGKPFSTAIPHKSRWPKAPKGTDFIVSLFGTSVHFVKEYAPEMKLVFVSLNNHSRISVMDRLRKRCEEHKLDPTDKFKKVTFYVECKVWELYDHVEFNDDTPEWCAENIVNWVIAPSKAA